MSQIRVLMFGAHPDDCELKAGGCAALWTSMGHVVRIVSLTNGDTGHYAMGGGILAKRRRDEAAAAAAVIGAESLVLDIHNGELMPDVTTRKQVIRIIREFEPDLILTHRPNDYHPDHRYTSQLVQDASYILRVPNMTPLTPPLLKPVVIMYFSDRFQKPNPFVPDVAVDITEVIETKIAMVGCHESQVFEWLPYDEGIIDQVPEEEAQRKQWLDTRMRARFSRDADLCREQLIATYGEAGREIRYAESFECCEYGARLTPEAKARLFPFLP
ncbi:MAG: PIG-L family deacetylase [Firmicutes bacterium]|nr:PIG-L family deacetylase [Bacillota bacterium]